MKKSYLIFAAISVMLFFNSITYSQKTNMHTGGQVTKNPQTKKGKNKMIKLHYDFNINVPADSVWSIVGDLTACSKWIPGITSAVMEGNNRTCLTADGNEIKEIITEYSNEERFFKYKQTQVPLPVKDSKGSFKIVSEGDGSKIIWDVEFQLLDPSKEKELVSMIDGYYKQTLESLKMIF